MTAILVDLDVLGDTRPLWDEWLLSARRLLPLDVDHLLTLDRAEAALQLDSSTAGNWRTLLERYAEDHAPVHLRPAADVSAALRRLASLGTEIGVFTDAPVELARVALAQLGATRRVTTLTAGADALGRLRSSMGRDATVVRDREGLFTDTA